MMRVVIQSVEYNQRILKNLREYLVHFEKLFKIRRWWTKPHILPHLRQIYGAHDTIFTYCKLNDHEEFYKLLGMAPYQFENLYSLTRPYLTKNSMRRPPLVAELRLAAVLYFLSQGIGVKSVATFFRIGRSTMAKMIPEVCEVLFKVLRGVYLQLPQEEQWLKIADDFYSIWNMPNAIGALDGYHIEVQAPVNSGSQYHNYKKFFSIVLMAVCDAHQRFIWASVGDYGSLNDSGIFQWSSLNKKILSGEIKLPEPRALPGTNELLPHFIIADGGFGLKTYCMTPYSRQGAYGQKEKIFNYRLSRARRIIECAFGTLQKKWKVLQTRIALNVQNVEIMVMTLLALHNYLITDNQELYLGCLDNHIELIENLEENIPENLIPVNNNNYAAARRIRNSLADYFLSPNGLVEWQWQSAHL